MRALLLLLGLLYLVAATEGFGGHRYTRSLWRTWKMAFEKRFSDVQEDSKRMRIFATNVHFIRAHNQRYQQGRETYATRLNQFSAMTVKEFQIAYLSSLLDSQPSLVSRIEYLSPWEYPRKESVDWRTKGYVTPVKNQVNIADIWKKICCQCSY